MPTDNIAAIDLGSNSFHMIIARSADGHMEVIDRMREMVQLAAGLDEDRKLSKEARQRALDCLQRFAQRLRQIPPAQVRIVATNTLRQARNSRSFIAKAEAIMGYPIEIISGVEEARLIYLGVVQSTGSVEGQRLVVDIGGGSTELIIGEGFEPLRLESLYMGCISMSQRFFLSKTLRESDLQAAEMMARLELQPVQSAYRKLGWNITTGASGTVKAIRDVVNRENWSHDSGISRESLTRLRKVLRESPSIDALAERWDLRPERAQVFAGGFTVLYGIFEALDIEYMQVADGALREGVVYDLLGRIRHEDVRERTIALLSRRYAIDGAQARRVAHTVKQLFRQVCSSWDLEEERFAFDLEWAAWLHEIGLAIAHSQYHKHGAYILEHADLPGFSRGEQMLLAALVRGHRRKFPLPVFEELPKKLMVPAQRLCILLRLAVLLHRGHRHQELPEIILKVKKQTLQLSFPLRWLETNPLTRADLQAEQQYLAKAGYGLLFR